MALPLSKHEEIAHFNAFVASLPANSYLADLLAGSAEVVENAIKNDLCFPSFNDSLKERAELAAEVKAEKESLRAEIAALHAERAKAARELLTVNRDLDIAKEAVATVCVIAKKYGKAA